MKKRDEITDKRRAERARMQKLLGPSEPPVAGDTFRLKGETFVVERAFPNGPVRYHRAEDPDAIRVQTLTYLSQAGAYYVEPPRTFKIDVAVTRADPHAKTDAYKLVVPGVLEATWSGRVEIARDIWAYIWKQHGAALVADMDPAELRLFSEKLGACGEELRNHPELQRAAVELTGTREASS